ncbi:MAG: GspE/PulE family protein [Candidatus Peregrinibacteria bacterium]|nr:GspE/PulE family protein [Candidatus Peregrinibacteria bacterium]
MADTNSANIGDGATTDEKSVTTAKSVENQNLNIAGTNPKQTDMGSSEGTAMDQVSQVNREFLEKSILKEARVKNMPYIDIERTPLNPDFIKVLDLETAKKAKMIPFLKASKNLRIAVSNPDNEETKKVLQSLKDSGFEVDLSLASEVGIEEAFKLYDATQKYKKIELVKSVEEKSIQTYEKEITALKDLPVKLATIPAEEALNLLDVAALKTKASDIHYEPSEVETVVRFRIDGVLHVVFNLPTDTYHRIANQIKFRSGMQLNINAIPQDGRYVFTFNERKIAVRVASIPTPYGESFVCRYLPSDIKALTLDELGFQGQALKTLQDCTKISQGMVLVTGPTGSGKSTTLYSMLNLMNSPEKKTITLEDPVEYYIRGVVQSQVSEKAGYSFADGLRSILRNDPNIVMLGEIRDVETAKTASQAALTGHVLLSTLHTNSALESIPRLVNMGLAPFMVAPALNTVVAQRLVRKVCPKCSTLDAITESEKKEFDDEKMPVPEKVPHAHGCDECSSTGYLGRLVIAEAITIDEEMKNLILKDASLTEIEALAIKKGMIKMKQDGLNKVAQGLTTMEEVFRTTNFSG